MMLVVICLTVMFMILIYLYLVGLEKFHRNLPNVRVFELNGVKTFNVENKPSLSNGKFSKL